MPPQKQVQAQASSNKNNITIKIDLDGSSKKKPKKKAPVRRKKPAAPPMPDPADKRFMQFYGSWGGLPGRSPMGAFAKLNPVMPAPMMSPVTNTFNPQINIQVPSPDYFHAPQINTATALDSFRQAMRTEMDDMRSYLQTIHQDNPDVTQHIQQSHIGLQADLDDDISSIYSLVSSQYTPPPMQARQMDMTNPLFDTGRRRLDFSDRADVYSSSSSGSSMRRTPQMKMNELTDVFSMQAASPMPPMSTNMLYDTQSMVSSLPFQTQEDDDEDWELLEEDDESEQEFDDPNFPPEFDETIEQPQQLQEIEMQPMQTMKRDGDEVPNPTPRQTFEDDAFQRLRDFFANFQSDLDTANQQNLDPPPELHPLPLYPPPQAFRSSSGSGSGSAEPSEPAVNLNEASSWRESFTAIRDRHRRTLASGTTRFLRDDTDAIQGLYQSVTRKPISRVLKDPQYNDFLMHTIGSKLKKLLNDDSLNYP